MEWTRIAMMSTRRSVTESWPLNEQTSREGMCLPRTISTAMWTVSAGESQTGVRTSCLRAVRDTLITLSFLLVVARTLKMGPAFTEQRDATRAHNAMLRTLISRVCDFL